MIKRGVSLYSYQQEQFFRRYNWKDMIREVHDNLQTDGIEIISESIVPRYPFPSEEFIFDWNNEMARYDMKAVTMDVFLDVHQFRDHVMTFREAAERLKNDIVIASKLRFENVRVLSSVPIEVIEMALDTAEKYNVRIGKEIHFPIPIRPREQKKRKYGMAAIRDFSMVQQIIDLKDRTGSPCIGLVPDFGIFQHCASEVTVGYEKRNAKCPEAIDFILENCGKYEFDELAEMVWDKYPDGGITETTLDRLALSEPVAQPEDIKAIVPYIISIHGKFYDMTEVPGRPGCFEDKSIDYENPIHYLKECGYDGYINSEYEGQRDQQDTSYDKLPDEIEQVRRHHQMLRRFIDGQG